ncbi:MAG: hypothetical protein K6G34_09505 [Lachnospiraceae bacterium]|nr:hypothetical protein [Lachnospiraceae bacterium]
MKKLRAVSVIVFIACLALLGVSTFKGGANKGPGPVIQMDAGVIEVSVNDGEEALKRGIVVKDAAGNDVTDTLEVESVSPFNEAGHRVVTYVAFDSKNKLARAQREVSYSDYTPPRFHFERPLLFPADSSNLLSGVTVEDCFDGVQFNNIWIQYDGIIDVSMPGDYPVVLETTNSAGDTSRISVTIEIYDETVRAGLPIIKLKEYVVYLEEGAQWDPQKYLDSVVIGGSEYDVIAADSETASAPAAGGVIEAGRINATGSVNTKIPGNYEVVYTYEDTENGTGTGSVRLYVVVTERRGPGNE